MTAAEGAGAPHEPDGTSEVRIFDTTLRDGEQAPRCTMGLREKLAVAEQLARLGVDVIEAGFPASSPGERDAVAAIAERVGRDDGPIVCGLARATAADIDVCAAALAGAPRRRIHTFIATSDLHLRHKLRISRPEVIHRVAEAVGYARTLAADVEFSPEDASRSDPEFLCEVLEAAIDAGATTLNVPDTVGYATPDEYGALIARVCALAARHPGVLVSTHCHDDLGLAVANSLAGVRAGARQVECTVNGIGERAGNAALEEIVMALHTRRAVYGAASRVRTHELARTSRVVCECTGVHVPPNKAIVGANAFAHEAGIHQDGVLKHRETYEIMTPHSVGADGSRLVLGKHSGRNAVRQRFAELGHALDDAQFSAAFERFKALADRKKMIDEHDLGVIARGEPGRAPSGYELVEVQAACGTRTVPAATVRVRTPDGRTCAASAAGSGPVEAVWRAIDSVVGTVGELASFSVRAVTGGIEGSGEVTVQIGDYQSGTFVGRSAHPDVVVAAAEAYVDAINRLVDARAGRAPAVHTPPVNAAVEVARAAGSMI